MIDRYLTYKGDETVDEKCYLWVYLFIPLVYLIIIGMNSFSLDLKFRGKLFYKSFDLL